VRSIAFPAISTGVYRFPALRAAEIAIQTVAAHIEDSGVEEVQFVCFNTDMLLVYDRLLAGSRGTKGLKD
jgi:O-acetyl-ADP-ribose deacetylase (regulator of RNase III)